jgi:uncharacterized membrane protein
MTIPGPSSETGIATGKDAAWVAYVLHAIGYLSGLMWPAIAGLIVNYVKRGGAQAGFIASHHAWMIRTFWYGLLWYLLSVSSLLWSAWPWLGALLRGARGSRPLGFEWDVLFSSVGALAIGIIGLLITWIWLLYRVIRGVVRLSDSRPMP